MEHNLDMQSNSEDDSIDQIDNSNQYLLNDKIQELYHALSNLKTFISNLKQGQNQGFEAQITQYSGNSQIPKLSQQKVIQLSQKRIQKMLKNKKTKKNWNQQDINILLWVVLKYSTTQALKSVHQFDISDWKIVSSVIPASSWKRCMFKWLSLKKFNLLQFRWTHQQSQILTKLVNKIGKKDWKILAEKLYLQNPSSHKAFRTSKQCRQHWSCYLNPTIRKGPWKVSEDIKLLQNVMELNGIKKWSQIAKITKGRTQNALKNRFGLLIDKQKKLTGEQSERQLINKCLIRLLHQKQYRSTTLKPGDPAKIQPVQIKSQIQFFQQQSSHKPIIELGKNFEAQKQSVSVFTKSPNKVIIPTLVHPENSYGTRQLQSQTNFFHMIPPNFNQYYFNFMYGGQF